MSETRGDYLDDYSVTCDMCHAHIGRVEIYHGRPQLHIGGLYLATASGWCACGCEYHWTTGGEHLRRMMAARERLAEVARDDSTW